MLTTILKLFLGTVLLVAIQACAPMVEAPPDPDVINTAIAQTLAAFTPTSEPEIPVTGPASSTPTETAIPPTPSATLSPVPVFTSTPAITPSVPQVSVSVPTNCRVGPGRAYDRIGGLLVDEVAEVVGRNATGDYWIIRNPNRTTGTCWLWGEYANVQGNASALPVFTPPPTPTPTSTPVPRADFAVAYDGLESCTDRGWWVDLAIENTGGIPFRSIGINVRDIENNTVVSLFANNFTDRTGCNETDTRDNLPPDVTRLVSSPAFDYDVNGRELRATVTLCSDLRQSGTCITKVLRFTP